MLYIGYLNKPDKDNIKYFIIPYGLKIFCPIDKTRVNASAKTHIDYLIGDYEKTETKFALVRLIKWAILLHLF